MTNEEKQALIEYCESRITDLAPYAKQRKLMEIALAALTAQPIKLPDVQVDNPIDGFFYRRDDVIAAIRAAGHEVIES